MKIALCSTGPSETHHISESLGKCPTFIIYDHQSLTFMPFKNSVILQDSEYGPNAIKILHQEHVDVLITCNIGKNAFEEATKLGIKIYKAQDHMTIKDSIYAYFNKNLKELHTFNKFTQK